MKKRIVSKNIDPLGRVVSTVSVFIVRLPTLLTIGLVVLALSTLGPWKSQPTGLSEKRRETFHVD